MTQPKDITPEKNSKPEPMLPKLLAAGVKLLVAVAIIVAAVLVFRYLMATSPKAKRQRPPRQAKLVQVIAPRKDVCVTTVRAMGPVIPAQKVTLHPQVAGRVVEISDRLIPGGVVQTGQKLVGIDPCDYAIAVRQRRGDIARALKDLKVEQGNQAVAKQEYELLGDIVTDEDRELVLREPHLASAQSALESAQAALEKAQVDLSRCDIITPFNAIVRDKYVDLGATVAAGSQLVSLVGTDQAWIDLKVSLYDLKWLTIPQDNGASGSKVRVFNTLTWGPDRYRTGRIVRLAPELETSGKMARTLVVVEDPFCLKPENHGRPKLLMGSLVQTEIEGRSVDSVFPVDRSHLRDNDTVWVLSDTDQLEIRPVEIAFRGPKQVFVSSGLAESDRLVTTDIAAPVPGMPLRVMPTGENAAKKTQVASDQEGRP